jgi:predicted nucleic acid-binding protein
MELSVRLFDAGMPLAVADLMIASICINRGLPLATKDRDFERISKIDRLRLRTV